MNFDLDKWIDILTKPKSEFKKMVDGMTESEKLSFIAEMQTAIREIARLNADLQADIQIATALRQAGLHETELFVFYG